MVARTAEQRQDLLKKAQERLASLKRNSAKATNRQLETAMKSVEYAKRISAPKTRKPTNVPKDKIFCRTSPNGKVWCKDRANAGSQPLRSNPARDAKVKALGKKPAPKAKPAPKPKPAPKKKVVSGEHIGEQTLIDDLKKYLKIYKEDATKHKYEVLKSLRKAEEAPAEWNSSALSSAYRALNNLWNKNHKSDKEQVVATPARFAPKPKASTSAGASTSKSAPKPKPAPKAKPAPKGGGFLNDLAEEVAELINKINNKAKHTPAQKAGYKRMLERAQKAKDDYIKKNPTMPKSARLTNALRALNDTIGMI